MANKPVKKQSVVCLTCVGFSLKAGDTCGYASKATKRAINRELAAQGWKFEKSAFVTCLSHDDYDVVLTHTHHTNTWNCLAKR